MQSFALRNLHILKPIWYNQSVFFVFLQPQSTISLIFAHHSKKKTQRMKRLFSTLFFLVATIAMMAQGWPNDYMGVMLPGFYWDSFKESRWVKLEEKSK